MDFKLFQTNFYQQVQSSSSLCSLDHIINMWQNLSRCVGLFWIGLQKRNYNRNCQGFEQTQHDFAHGHD